jgi:predicted ester cyclase
MTEGDRDIGRRWFEEAWNKGRREAIPDMLAPDGVIHDGGVDSVARTGSTPFFDRMNAALSEFRVTVQDNIAERDRVCVRRTCTAKHTGTGLDIPASGKRINVTGISIIRVLMAR